MVVVMLDVVVEGYSCLSEPLGNAAVAAALGQCFGARLGARLCWRVDRKIACPGRPALPLALPLAVGGVAVGGLIVLALALGVVVAVPARFPARAVYCSARGTSGNPILEIARNLDEPAQGHA